MELTEFSASSPLVQKYAITGDGLPEDAPTSEIVDTPRKVVIIDAFLRKHADTLSEHELEVITGLRISDIRDIVLTFQSEGLIELEDSLYTVSNMNDDVTALRKFQNELENNTDKE